MLTKNQRRGFWAELCQMTGIVSRDSLLLFESFCSGKQDGIREIADSFTNQFLLLTGTTCNAQSCDLRGKRGYNTYALLPRIVMMV